MNEIWKDIAGFEGYYQVSNIGRVRSIDRLIKYPNGVINKFKGRIKKNSFDTRGYPHAYLLKNCIGKTIKVHRLVAIAFIPNPENKRTVNHKNGIKTDNRVENLEWATGIENMRHAWDTGLKVGKKHSEETRIKRSASLRESWIKRKAV